MILRKQRGTLGLTALVFILSANAAFSQKSEVKEDVEVEAELEGQPYAVSRPGPRNALSAKILEKMRTELMSVMGVKLDDSGVEAAAKKAKGH
ncbi:MAG: hypothetical protein KUG74_05225 [Rhodobacteraceae bacterium]|nr:hypothetical protein [Paracoccaceae bacterium]